MRDGDQFEAEYDGNRTMLVFAKKGGNLGKPITVKYRVHNRRPIPPGEVAAQAILDSIKAAAARHPDFERYHLIMKRIASSTPAGSLTPDEYIEKVYQLAKQP